MRVKHLESSSSGMPSSIAFERNDASDSGRKMKGVRPPFVRKMKSPSRTLGNARPIDPCGNADPYSDISSELAALPDGVELGSVTNMARLSNQSMLDMQCWSRAPL